MTDSTIPHPPPDDQSPLSTGAEGPGEGCPICGKSLAFVGVQTYPPAVNQPDDILVHCTNIDCDLFEQTATPEHLHANWRDYLKKPRP